jgi:hypothetical protein
VRQSGPNHCLPGRLAQATPEVPQTLAQLPPWDTLPQPPPTPVVVTVPGRQRRRALGRTPFDASALRGGTLDSPCVATTDELARWQCCEGWRLQGSVLCGGGQPMRARSGPQWRICVASRLGHCLGVCTTGFRGGRSQVPVVGGVVALVVGQLSPNMTISVSFLQVWLLLWCSVFSFTDYKLFFVVVVQGCYMYPVLF